MADSVFSVDEELEPVPSLQADEGRDDLERLRVEIAKLGRQQMKASTVAETNWKAVIQAVEASGRARVDDHLVSELLSIVDALDESIAQGTDMTRAGRMPAEWVEGITMIRERANRMLGRYEVTAIEVVGKVFDPALCVAVGVEHAAEAEENTVITEQRRGYRLRDKVLRYAEVIIAKKG